MSSDWLLKIPVLFFGVVIHECAHGLAALRAGDPTAKLEGRITLNPIPHIDPFMTIFLPAMLILTNSSLIIGGAKPVPVNPYNFRNPKKDDLIVSLAGPLSNLALAFIFSLALGLLRIFDYSEFLVTVARLFQFGILINVWLAVFNMIPLPPLDGSHVLRYFLPAEAARAYESLRPYGFLILILILMTPISRILFMPAQLLIRFFFGISGLL
jgi:Zn-dependent protease